MSSVSVKQTTSAVKVTAQSSPTIRVEVIARGPQGRPGNDATSIGDVDLGTFN